MHHWRQFAICLGLCLLTTATVFAKEFSAVPVFEAGQDGYNVYRIPAMIKAANGDLLVFCEARVGGDASEIDLVLKRSTDSGKTWGPLQVVQESSDFQSYFPQDAKVDITIGNPCPVVDHMDPDHAGRIWLPFNLENDRVFVTYSDDHGQTWAKRRDITKDVKLEGWGWYATGPVHAIQIQRGPHKGRLVVPADHRIGKPGQDRGVNGVQVVISDDHGQTWKLGAVDDSYDDGLNSNETTVVELNDGSLYFNTRDQHGSAPGTRGGTISRDGGETFEKSTDSKHSPFVPVLDPIDPPVVQCALLRAASKLDGDKQNLILFSGPDESGPTGKGRSDMRIRYSTDEAKSWQDGPLIYTGPAAYSDMVKLAPNTFGIVFESDKPGGKLYTRIQFTRFTTQDVLGQ
ncbi:sialidase family protein [Thalassoroseus pseudoceratinae]|uniref:sialidase family protein n=1 Tax=Thalassoroseus pseudoceratinae TaxID=2713176 RepID=UPI00141E61F3|nr:sialidase family protein [Thalassoroseus pseudoceratinae]